MRIEIEPIDLYTILEIYKLVDRNFKLIIDYDEYGDKFVKMDFETWSIEEVEDGLWTIHKNGDIVGSYDYQELIEYLRIQSDMIKSIKK